MVIRSVHFFKSRVVSAATMGKKSRRRDDEDFFDSLGEDLAKPSQGHEVEDIPASPAASKKDKKNNKKKGASADDNEDAMEEKKIDEPVEDEEEKTIFELAGIISASVCFPC